MSLITCRHLHGACVVHQGLPPIETHDDVVYLPNTAEHGAAWGIFGADRQLVPITGFHRGPVRHLAMQAASTGFDVGAVTETAPEPVYLYGGAIHTHYGHFLLSTLSRLWPLAVPGSLPSTVLGGVRPKILCNAGDDPAAWFAHPHIGFCFTHLGLTPQDFVRFDRPVRLRRLIVAQPAFEELSAAWPAFATLGHAIGDAALAGNRAARSTLDNHAARRTTPAYLSKTRLTSGVWRFSNEDAVVETLARHGVDIVFPEQLSLTEQIRIFAEREVVLGTVSSALHTSILASGCARIVGLNFQENLVSNYPLMDAVNAAPSRYLYPEHGLIDEGADACFTLNMRLPDPVAAAEDMLRAIETKPAADFRVIALTPPLHASLPDVPTPAVLPETAMPDPIPSLVPGLGPLADTLDAIGLRHGTDKASFHHNFLVFYERFFAPLRHVHGLKLLEIGVYDGASLRMWEEYFPHGRIAGIDVDPATLRHATARASVDIVDQSDVMALVAFATRHGPFDIIIDDGSHVWDHQVTSLRCLYPFVKPGGFYVVEDLDTSYGRYVPDYQGIATETAAQYLHRLCDYLVGDSALDIAREPDAFIRSFAPVTECMSFYRRTCVMQRKP